MRIVAHRGASGYLTENTLPAFEMAIQLGVDAIEFDVRRTKDGHLVIVHDPNLLRLTGHDIEVKTSTYKELKTVFPPLVTFSELLHALPLDKIRLTIELKGDDVAWDTFIMLKAAVDQGLTSFDRVIAISFNEKELMSYRLAANYHGVAGVMTGRIIHPTEGLHVGFQDTGQVVGVYYQLITAEVIDMFHQAGKQVYAWTVNDGKDMKALQSLGVDGIITDFPDRAMD